MKERMPLFGAFALVLVALLAACPDPVPPGDRLFWVNDLGHGWEQIDTKLVYSNGRCNAYVRTTDLGSISESLVTMYADYFRDVSWPNVTSNVYMPAEFFEEPGDRINILFYDMGEDGPAGYFWSKDFYEYTPGMAYPSNETNVFYMNIGAAVSSTNQAYATAFTKGTLTHEFQHMCNAHYFFIAGSPGYDHEREMDSWANEFCSVMMESMYAGQYPIYVDSYNDDSAGDYRNARTDFLYWDNNFTQYTTVSLLGGYVLSELAGDTQRENLVKTFLAHTNGEDNDPNTYDSTPDYVFKTSVDDLVAALQDNAVDYDARVGGLWTSSADFYSDPTAVGANWSVVMKRFLTAMTSGRVAFKNFLDDYDYSGTFPAISPRVVSAGTTSVALKMSAFMIGEVNSTDLGSDSKAATQLGAINAYILMWNGAVPNAARLINDTKVLASGNATFGVGILMKPVGSELPSSRAIAVTSWNRASGLWRPSSRAAAASKNGYSGGSDIPGAGNSANGSDGTSGYLYCGYASY